MGGRSVSGHPSRAGEVLSDLKVPLHRAEIECACAGSLWELFRDPFSFCTSGAYSACEKSEVSGKML